MCIKTHDLLELNTYNFTTGHVATFEAVVEAVLGLPHIRNVVSRVHVPVGKKNLRRKESTGAGDQYDQEGTGLR